MYTDSDLRRYSILTEPLPIDTNETVINTQSTTNELFSILERDYFQKMDKFFCSFEVKFDVILCRNRQKLPTDFISLVCYVVYRNCALVWNKTPHTTEISFINYDEECLTIDTEVYNISTVYEKIRLLTSNNSLRNRVELYRLVSETLFNSITSLSLFTLDSLIKTDTTTLCNKYSDFIDSATIDRVLSNTLDYHLSYTLEISKPSTYKKLVRNGIKDILNIKPTYFVTSDNNYFYLNYDGSNIDIDNFEFSQSKIFFSATCIVRPFSKDLWEEVAEPLIKKICSLYSSNTENSSHFLSYWDKDYGTYQEITTTVIDRVNDSVYSSLFDLDEKLLNFIQ